jgi:hypothetical protein
LLQKGFTFTGFDLRGSTRFFREDKGEKMAASVLVDRNEAMDVRNTCTLRSARQREQVKNLGSGDVYFLAR